MKIEVGDDLEPCTFVLITGASSGIGREIARTLSSENRLILCGRDQERLQETKNLCAQSEQHLVWSYDLADTSQIGEALKEFLREKEAFVSSFVHSAGMSPISPLRMLTTAQMHEIMDVNFFSAAEILKVLCSKKINKKSLQSVVLISSIASQFGTKGQSVYAASKAALDAFMRSIAVELAPRTRLNSVLPGGIETAMSEPFLQSGIDLSAWDPDYLLGRGKTKDIANMVEFLLSDKARWITGQSFIVDGGKTAF